MAAQSAVDSFWATFSEMRKLLYRHILLLFFVTIPITYQIICIEFIIEEWSDEYCGTNGTCTTRSTGNNSSHHRAAISPSRQTEEFEGLQQALIAVHYCSMSLGVILLGLAADRYGRLKVLFPTSIVMFIAAFSSAFFLKKFHFLFFLFRFIVGLAAGGAALCVLTLTAEYADPFLRAYVMSTIWLAAAIANISLPGFAYAIVNKESLLAVISLPFLVSLLIWRIVPESPRWKLLHSSLGPREESRMLLKRYVSEERQNESKFRSCWSLWGHFSLTSLSESREGEPEWRWWRCLRYKEFRRTFFTLCFSWFALGLLFRALDNRSIQLLANFFINYAVRSLISIPAIIFHCLLIHWLGRRLLTTLCIACGGLLILILLISSSKHHSTTEAVDIILQLIGRGFVEMSVMTLALYTMELFPTVLRCSAVGVMAAVTFFGVAVAPFVMKIDPFHPIVPLGIMGGLAILSALLSYFMLPETKGTSTRETVDDSENLSFQCSSNRSPKIHRRARHASDDSGRDSPEGGSGEEWMENNENDARDTGSLASTLGRSWELSFDRVSRASRWEWLSYEDARRSNSNSAVIDSLSIEQSLKEESNILSEEDVKKLSKRLPGSTWILVYSTYYHGITLSTLYYRMREFDSPVLMVIKDDKGYVFGVFAPVSLRVDPNFYGAGRSFFFTCKPKFKVYPCSGKNEYYMSGDVDSLAFGCTEGTFGLWLDKELYHGRSTACETYDSDVLSGTEDFICHGLEAWVFE